jgi:hypothetical protein
LAVEGIYCMHGQNAVEAGVQQVRLRLQKQMLLISKECRKLRGEADLYRMQDRPDGEFAVVKEADHLLDAMRYLCMTRIYDPATDMPVKQPLGFRPGFAPSVQELSMYVPPRCMCRRATRSARCPSHPELYLPPPKEAPCE